MDNLETIVKYLRVSIGVRQEVRKEQLVKIQHG
ncbi:hypothetical protein FEP45_05822 [Burkholderia multivorans]|nr:hypothetical protein [Burkholderia multivorans]MDR9160748.1 hypothetical protein [Burkholderia multivorans]